MSYTLIKSSSLQVFGSFFSKLFWIFDLERLTLWQIEHAGLFIFQVILHVLNLQKIVVSNGGVNCNDVVSTSGLAYCKFFCTKTK